MLYIFDRCQNVKYTIYLCIHFYAEISYFLAGLVSETAKSFMDYLFYKQSTDAFGC